MSVSIPTHQPDLLIYPVNQTSAELLRQHVISERKRLMERPSTGPRPIADALAGRKTQRYKPAPGELSPRQLMRSGGATGHAAVLLERTAQCDPDPEIAAERRAIALRLRALAGRPRNREFDFMKGNFHLGDECVDALFARVGDAARTPVQGSHATAQFLAIARHVRWHNHECLKSVSELASYRRVGRGQAVKDNQLLAQIGLISFVTRGRATVIVVNPEGVFRGKVKEAHSATADAYRAAIPPGRTTGGPACG
jgi:hypothetical protein